MSAFEGTRMRMDPVSAIPHPESRDQIGHFLTGVGLAYDPSRVSRPIRVPVVGDASFPTWARVRDLLSAPPGASGSGGRT